MAGGSTGSRSPRSSAGAPVIVLPSRGRGSGWSSRLPADEGAYSRIEVDDRGRIPIEAGLRSRLSLEPGDRVVVRIRPDTDAVEIANQWIVAVALAGFDCTSRADQDGERQQRTYKAFSTTNKEARNG